jgi:hypothetical protein
VQPRRPERLVEQDGYRDRGHAGAQRGPGGSRSRGAPPPLCAGTASRAARRRPAGCRRRAGPGQMGQLSGGRTSAVFAGLVGRPSRARSRGRISAYR